MHLSRTLSAATATILACTAALVGLTTAPALAAPCPSGAPTPAPRVTAKPWPQQLWDLSRLPPGADGHDVIVAVVDSGVAEHQQLAGRVLPGFDALPQGGTDGRQDCVGHGTGVASIIAAKPVPGGEFRGIAPAARILPIRVSEKVGGKEKEDEARRALDPDMAKAIRWAVDHGAKVMNLSLSYTDAGPDGLPEIRAAVDYALAKDVVVVAAAGNGKSAGNKTPYPAAWPGVLGVGAISADGQRQAQSQTGPYVDIVAPGENVTGAWPGGGQLANLSGTSYAAPMVAGAAALVRQWFPHLDREQVVRRLLATADPAPGGLGSEEYGAGVVDPVRAVTDVLDDGVRATPAALVPPKADPAAEAAAADADRLRDRSLWLAGIGIGLAVLVLGLALALPSGMRRRWRPAGAPDAPTG
ncbi:type VII secretion-associated serine protease mycosin [Catellatospora tritici]|uniref:type VII secretion-associated serine protease mycosin n=1 Tax=Catellatospora tritici TaxID=2851566 RepID=UPI001C2D695E|nr:type VII secretion-associated serine protease mycosin [Catellatospora tritici]MBV1851948.1 type VII secretion-associated serine protease mycosin [Catellatospora tritici]